MASAGMVFQFSFNGNINNISLDYKRKVAIVIMTIIVKRFEQQSPPLTLPDFAALYHMPSRLVTELISEMSEAGLVSIVYSETDKDQHAYQPAMDINKISVGLVLDRLNKLGTTEFIPNFKTEFAPVIKVVADAVKDIIDKESEILLMNLPVNIDGTPTKIK